MMHTTKYPVLRKGFNPPPYVTNKEAYSLFYFLATGESLKRHYFDQRNQVIHNAIEHMYKTGWVNKSIDSLIYALSEDYSNRDSGELERAGGETYIRKLLGNFDPETDLEVV